MARPEVLDGEAGNVPADVLDARRVGALNVLLGLRIDRERHVLNPGRTLGRGDDDFLLIGRISLGPRSGRGLRMGR